MGLNRDLVRPLLGFAFAFILCSASLVSGQVTNPNIFSLSTGSEILGSVVQINVDVYCATSSGVLSHDTYAIWQDPDTFEWCGLLTGLPHGVCNFTAIAVDSNNQPVAAGGWDGVSIPATGIENVVIYLIGQIAAQSGGNVAPIITSMGSVPTQTGWLFSVTAFDPESSYCSNGNSSFGNSGLSSTINLNNANYLCYNGNGGNGSPGQTSNSLYGVPLTYSWSIVSLVCDGLPIPLNVPTLLNGNTPNPEVIFDEPLYQNATCTIMMEVEVSDGQAHSFHSVISSRSSSADAEVQAIFIQYPLILGVTVEDSFIAPVPSILGTYSLAQSHLNFTLSASYLVGSTNPDLVTDMFWYIESASTSSQFLIHPLTDGPYCDGIFNDLTSVTHLDPDATGYVPISSSGFDDAHAYLVSNDYPYMVCPFRVVACNEWVPIESMPMQYQCSWFMSSVIVAQHPDVTTSSIISTDGMTNCRTFSGPEVDLRMIIKIQNPTLEPGCNDIENICVTAICSGPGFNVLAMTHGDELVNPVNSTYPSLLNEPAYHNSIYDGCDPIGPGFPDQGHWPVFDVTCEACNDTLVLTDLVQVWGAFVDIEPQTSPAPPIVTPYFAVLLNLTGDAVDLFDAQYLCINFGPNSNYTITFAWTTIEGGMSSGRTFVFRSRRTVDEDGFDCSLYLRKRSIETPESGAMATPTALSETKKKIMQAIKEDVAVQKGLASATLSQGSLARSKYESGEREQRDGKRHVNGGNGPVELHFTTVLQGDIAFVGIGNGPYNVSDEEAIKNLISDKFAFLSSENAQTLVDSVSHYFSETRGAQSSNEILNINIVYVIMGLMLGFIGLICILVSFITYHVYYSKHIIVSDKSIGL